MRFPGRFLLYLINAFDAQAFGYLTALAMSAIEKWLLRWRPSGH
jgi:hypothetical protein